jgi:hypothetical protein
VLILGERALVMLVSCHGIESFIITRQCMLHIRGSAAHSMDLSKITIDVLSIASCQISFLPIPGGHRPVSRFCVSRRYSRVENHLTTCIICRCNEGVHMQDRWIQWGVLVIHWCFGIASQLAKCPVPTRPRMFGSQ